MLHFLATAPTVRQRMGACLQSVGPRTSTSRTEDTSGAGWSANLWQRTVARCAHTVTYEQGASVWPRAGMRWLVARTTAHWLSALQTTTPLALVLCDLIHHASVRSAHECMAKFADTYRPLRPCSTRFCSTMQLPHKTRCQAPASLVGRRVAHTTPGCTAEEIRAAADSNRGGAHHTLPSSVV